MQIKRRLLKLSSPFWVFIASVVAVVLFSHLWLLGSLPQGLYVDESSIGLNAASVATSLRDEHHKLLPIYFEAFGEYKNPIYIYAASILFALFGVSDFVLRFTSFLFYLVFLWGLIALVREIFPRNKFILGYAIISAGFLPWIFTLSRISFEVISQPAIMMWAIYFFVRAYRESNRHIHLTYAATMTGILTGLSVYTYSTSRLLSFAFLVSIYVIYFHRHYWRRHIYLTIGVILPLIPYATFSITQPGALTHRFSLITYVFDPQLDLLEKISIFLSNYFSYLDLNFLLFSGDPNLRHHIGFGGEVYIAVFILFMLGVIALSNQFARSTPDKQFILFLVFNLVSAPAAAALTEANHSLRSVMLGLYILLFSFYGLSLLQRISRKRLRYGAIITVFFVLIIESALYVNHYFKTYPRESIAAFESYGFKQELIKALEYEPRDIVVTKYANQPYAHLDYYRYQLPMTTMPIYIADPVAASKRCIIYFAGSEPHLNDASFEVAIEDTYYYSRLRCYR